MPAVTCGQTIFKTIIQKNTQNASKANQSIRSSQRGQLSSVKIGYVRQNLFLSL